jgi:ketosteroid isomerase-like protein
MIDRAGVDRWLDDYVAAWKSYDRDAIGALFADDVEYRYHPYDDPVRGRDSVVAAWREEAEFPGASGRDEPGIYDGSYRAVAIDGDVAVAVGQSTYTDGPDGPAEVYDNCFLLRFDDEGRCREFTEWFVKRPLGADA